jgi:hypothetical protein
MDRKQARTVLAHLLIERSPVSRRDHIPMRFDGVHSQFSGCSCQALMRPLDGGVGCRLQGIDSMNT